MVKMASGMDHGHVHPTTTMSRNMAAIQLIPSHAVLAFIFDIRHPYDV